MILVDTSVWIDFFRAKRQVHSEMKAALSNRRVVAAECVFGELLQGARGVREREIVQGYWQNLPKREERGLWIEAGNLSARRSLYSKGVGLVDAFLLAFAEKYDLKIWTLDKKFFAVIDPPRRHVEP